jgi:hypothetical protein
MDITVDISGLPEGVSQHGIFDGLGDVTLAQMVAGIPELRGRGVRLHAPDGQEPYRPFDLTVKVGGPAKMSYWLRELMVWTVLDAVVAKLEDFGGIPYKVVAVSLEVWAEPRAEWPHSSSQTRDQCKQNLEAMGRVRATAVRLRGLAKTAQDWPSLDFWLQVVHRIDLRSGWLRERLKDLEPLPPMADVLAGRAGVRPRLRAQIRSGAAFL